MAQGSITSCDSGSCWLYGLGPSQSHEKEREIYKPTGVGKTAGPFAPFGSSSRSLRPSAPFQAVYRKPIAGKLESCIVSFPASHSVQQTDACAKIYRVMNAAAYAKSVSGPSQADDSA